MVLNSLVMTDFRQFRGTHRIYFACGDKNVTVLLGQNGRGKTGIFRAVMFCLYGDRKLPQDRDVLDEEIHLVNLGVLQKASGTPIEAVVELQFTHRGYIYLLKRGVRAVQTSLRVKEEVHLKQLLVTDPTGNTRSIEVSKIDQEVNKVLDSRIRDYFLFDGEMIERLTMATTQQRNEVSRGIRSLLDIDSLEAARKAATKAVRTLNSELSKNTDSLVTRTVAEIDKETAKKNSSSSRLEQIKLDLGPAEKEKKDLDAKLRSYTAIMSLLQERESLEKQRGSIEAEQKELLIAFKALQVRTATHIVIDAARAVYSAIGDRKAKGEIPSEIRRDLIQKILDEHKCICGNEIKQGEPSYEAILGWLEKTEDPAVQDAVLNLWRYLGELLNQDQPNREAAFEKLKRFGDLSQQEERCSARLLEISSQLGTEGDADISALEQQRKRVESKILQMTIDQRDLEKSISLATDQINSLNARLQLEKVQAAKEGELARRVLLAQEVKNALDKAYDGLVGRVRTTVSQKTTEFFHELIDSHGAESLGSITIDQDYSLQVHNRWGGPFLADISVGQRQIVSISFILALIGSVVKENLLEVPLLMDTPLGKLSSTHRDNVISRLPNVVSQCILLSTDTEFTKIEARLLTDTEKWGRFYQLTPVADGATDVQHIPIVEAFTMLQR